MKRKSLLIIISFFCVLLFSNEWKLKEVDYETFVYYQITDAPGKYGELINSIIYSWQTRSMYRNLFPESCETQILNYLKNEEFEIEKLENKDTVFLPIAFMENVFPEVINPNFKLGEKELSYIWKMLSTRYAGFSKMKKKGFNKEDFLKIQNTDELKQCLDEYIEDCHFNIRIKEFSYSQNTAYDDGSKISSDASNIYFEKETSNSYYVRFTGCPRSGTEYNSKLPKVSQKAKDKDFIILDARSNNGGSDLPQIELRNKLNAEKYKGTVIVLQDNWSFSSGEVWHIFGVDGLKFKRVLVGTHSGGMQNYGNCKTYENKKLNIAIYFGYTDFTKDIPSNYLGDGKGYEPDIWATTQTMKSTLEGLGVDLTGIEFQ